MKIGHVKRNPGIALKVQLAELAEKYSNFQYLFCAGSVHGGANITFTYEEEKNMPKKYVIFRKGSWKFTTAENYHARIRNERRVTNCEGFGSPAEIIEYFCSAYADMKPEEFEVIGG